VVKLFFPTKDHKGEPKSHKGRIVFLQQDQMISHISPEYYYKLPEERIAQYPLPERDLSKLLVYRDGGISTDIFRNASDYIPHGSLLVFNNTKVIRARLIFRKDSGARIEIFCLEPSDPADYSVSFSSRNRVEWKCLIGNLKRWKSGPLELDFKSDNRRFRLIAERISGDGDSSVIRFTWDNGDLTFGDIIESAGHIPLPPYINRDDEDSDTVTYQTIYSLVKGSVAAPTAGLHFTRKVFDELDKKDIERAYLTLHVGAGTFQPVKDGNLTEHKMHTEHFYVTAETIESLIKKSGKIIAVGTTSVRTLESLYWIGCKLGDGKVHETTDLFTGQWDPYESNDGPDPSQALENILDYMSANGLKALHAPTRIIIVPGYRFRITNGIITNFHQPGSTLLLLVSAWVGEKWTDIYRYALDNGFRFLSYGDSSLLL